MNIIKDLKDAIGKKNVETIYKLFNFKFSDKNDDLNEFISSLPENMISNVILKNRDRMVIAEEKLKIYIKKDYLIDFSGNSDLYFNIKFVFKNNNESSLTLFNELAKKELLITSLNYDFNGNTLIVEKFKNEDYSLLIVDRVNQMKNKKLDRKILSEFFSLALNNTIQESIDIINLKNDFDVSQDKVLIEMMKSFKNEISMINQQKKLKHNYKN